MAVTIQTINIGTVAGDGTGDKARPGAIKINDNFTNLKAAADLVLDIPQDRIMGRITASTGDAEQLTGSQATSLLDLFATDSTTQGLVPGSNSVGATYFLNAAGAWSVPSPTGGPADNLTLNVRKGSVGTITKGSPVYLSGYNVGGYYEVEQADGDVQANMPAIGIAGEDITSSATVTLVVFGTLEGMNTSAWSVGDALYVSDTGTLTTTRPVNSDDWIQKVGTVARSNVTNGVIYVAGAFRTNDTPNIITVDTINELNAAAGVTIDGVLIKDNEIAWSYIGTTPTTLSGYGISDTKTNFDTALSDGTFMYTGDAPTAHTHTEDDIQVSTNLIVLGRTTAGAGDVEEIGEATFKSMMNLEIGTDVQAPATTLSGYGISDTKANFNTALSDGSFMYVGDAPTAHNHDSDYISIIIGGTEDNFAVLTATGELADSGFSSDSFSTDPHQHTVSQITASTTNLIMGRVTAGAGAMEELTDVAVRAIINVEDGATADQTAAEIEAIVSHNNLQDHSANEHIDWTNASSAFTTTGVVKGGSVYAGNPTLTTDDLFLMGAVSSTVPYILFDAGDYIQFDRTSNLFSVLIGNALQLSFNASAFDFQDNTITTTGTVTGSNVPKPWTTSTASFSTPAQGDRLIVDYTSGTHSSTLPASPSEGGEPVRVYNRHTSNRVEVIPNTGDSIYTGYLSLGANNEYILRPGEVVDFFPHVANTGWLAVPVGQSAKQLTTEDQGAAKTANFTIYVDDCDSHYVEIGASSLQMTLNKRHDVGVGQSFSGHIWVKMNGNYSWNATPVVVNGAQTIEITKGTAPTTSAESAILAYIWQELPDGSTNVWAEWVNNT